MKLFSTLLTLACLFFGPTSHADQTNSYAPQCNYSIGLDSFNYGIYFGYAALPQIEYPSVRQINLNCLFLGYNWGSQIRAQNCKTHTDRTDRCENNDCWKNFVEGYNFGRTGKIPSRMESCYAAGQSAGRSILHFGARENNVGLTTPECLKGYQRGREDGRRNAPRNPGTFDSPEQDCYILGHYEAWLF